MKLNHSMATLLLFFSAALALHSVAQVRIISSSFSSYNVSAETMCNLNISCSTGESSAVVEARIMNAQGANLIMATSLPFQIKAGVFNTSQLGMKISGTAYQSSAMSEYIKLYHQLPSGKYSYCIHIKLSDGSSDDLCEDIESENSSFMSLINPTDKDTIENDHPVLIWNHTESFNVLQQGEFYRLLVTEIKYEQGADASIQVNSPLFQANFLTRHDVLYPFDAPRLIPGGHYAWQVQKIVNGVITNKTEAWEFILKGKNNKLAKSFVEITERPNSTPYLVKENRLFFTFREEYFSQQTALHAALCDAQGNVIAVTAKNISGKSSAALKNIESSRYELDLRELGLKDGYYTLRIFNEKNQAFTLNFQYDN